MGIDAVLADIAFRQKVTVLRPSGGNDGTLINAALAAAAATVGVGNTPGTVTTKPVVQLSGGVFNINTKVVVPSLVHLKGSGFATTLKAKTGLNDHVVEGSGAQMWGSRISDLTIDANKANQSGGTSHGLNWLSHGSFSPYVSGTHVVGGGIDSVSDVFIVNAQDNGLNVATGAGEARFRNVVSFGAGVHAMACGAADCWFTDCTFAGCGSYGIYANCQVSRWTGCKVYGTGESGVQATGSGVYVNGVDNAFSNCEVQEVPYDAWNLPGNASGTILSGCSAKGYGAVGLILAASHCQIDLRVNDGYTYTGTEGVHFTGTPGDSMVRLQNEAASQPVTGSPVGNTVIVNTQLGQQSVAYAAAITPLPYKGGSVIVGALTGDITVNVPAAGTAHAGVRMALQFTQDGTGGRTVTFAAGYVMSWLQNKAASSVQRVEFEYDGTNWVQLNLQVPLGRLTSAFAEATLQNFTTSFATLAQSRVPISTTQQPVVTGKTLQVRAIMSTINATVGDSLGIRIVDDSVGTILQTDNAAVAADNWITGSWVNAPAGIAGWYIQVNNATSARGSVQRAYVETRYV